MSAGIGSRCRSLTYVAAEVESESEPRTMIGSTTIWSEDVFFEPIPSVSWESFLEELASMDGQPTATSMDVDNAPISESSTQEPVLNNISSEQPNTDLPYGHIKGTCQSQFEEVRNQQMKEGTFPFGPCRDEGEWEFLEWAVESGLSHGEIEKLLALKIVSRRKYRICVVSSPMHSDSREHGPVV